MHMQQKLVLGLFALLAAAATLIGGLVVSSVSAGAPAISVGGLTRFVGEQGAVEVKASGITAPGLGSWTIDIVYDPAVVSVAECDPAPGSFCNETYGADTVRVAGFSGDGLIGNSVLASITFQCDAQSDSGLSINPGTLVFRDGTAGDPQDIAATLGANGILCMPTLETPVAPTATPVAPTATPVTSPKPVGDVNCDWQTTGGVPTIADAQLIAQVVLQLIAEDDLDCPDNADVDGDGSITIGDAQLIAQFVLGNISWPPS